MQNIYFFGSSYIIPNMDTIVCGGTAQLDWDRNVSESDTKKIMDDIFEYFPEMKSSEVVSQTVTFFSLYLFSLRTASLIFNYFLAYKIWRMQMKFIIDGIMKILKSDGVKSPENMKYTYY